MSQVAAQAVQALRRAGATVATAESLTGGLVCSTLVAVPGASEVVRGGVVAYAADVKSSALGVDPSLIASRGTVDAGVAQAMAAGVRERLGATYGVATTGVAGPDSSEGKPVGMVYVAIAGPAGVQSRELALAGDRLSIREATVDALLAWLADRVGEETEPLGG